jgi:hypothetical protein
MKNLEDKKISVSFLIFSVLHILMSYINKTPNENYKWMRNGKPKYTDQPISSYNTNLLIFETPLNFAILILVIILGISVYCFIFKTDEELKGIFEKIKNYKYKIRTPIVIRKLITTVKDFYGSGNIEVERQKYKTIESTPEGKMYLTINELKADVFSKFIILIFVFIIECGISQINSTAFVIILILIILQKLYSAHLCDNLSVYNRGTSWFWLLFGFIFPAIALYFASSKLTLLPEYKILYKKYENK